LTKRGGRVNTLSGGKHKVAGASSGNEQRGGSAQPFSKWVKKKTAKEKRFLAKRLGIVGKGGGGHRGLASASQQKQSN